jgi:hypothetical protein
VKLLNAAKSQLSHLNVQMQSGSVAGNLTNPMTSVFVRGNTLVNRIYC